VNLDCLRFIVLEIVARWVASAVPLDAREDVHQAAWEYFVRYPPRTLRFAFKAARNARTNLYRRELYQRKVARANVLRVNYCDDWPAITARLELQRLAVARPRAFHRVLGMLFQPPGPIPGKIRRRQTYYRKQLRAA